MDDADARGMPEELSREANEQLIASIARADDVRQKEGSAGMRQ